MIGLRLNPRSPMKKHTPEQIVAKLRRIEALTVEGHTIGEAAREVGISEPTYYRWRRQYGTMSQDEARRLKRLEAENARLKKLVAELSLDNDMLKEVARGKF